MPSESPAIGSAKEGHGGLDFTDYVRHIDAVGGKFGLIVVDGRAREACLTAALDHLEPDGIIVFDNTLRRRYRRAIAAAPVVEQVLPRAHPDAALPRPDEHPPALTASRPSSCPVSSSTRRWRREFSTG